MMRFKFGVQLGSQAFLIGNGSDDCKQIGGVEHELAMLVGGQIGVFLIYRTPEWKQHLSGWWFQIFFIFTPTWGNDPIWLIFFRIFQMG